MTSAEEATTSGRATGARGGSKDDRNRLIEEHLGLAWHLVSLFEHRGESRDDLRQVASMGLVHAADRFDPTLGFEFSTFATKTIMGELKRHFRDRVWAVKMPRTLQELYLEVTAAVNELTQSLGRQPSVQEVARSIDRRDDEVLTALEAGQGYRAASLDAPGVVPEGTSPEALEVSDAVVSIADRDELESHLATLSPRDRELLRLRFVDELSQAAIAKRVGISQMHVSRLLRRALDELRRSYGVTDVSDR
jgi:RNA polymerase sigma-B factor